MQLTSCNDLISCSVIVRNSALAERLMILSATALLLTSPNSAEYDSWSSRVLVYTHTEDTATTAPNIVFKYAPLVI